MSKEFYLSNIDSENERISGYRKNTFSKNEIIIYSINHFNCLTYVLKFNTAMDSKRDL